MEVCVWESSFIDFGSSRDGVKCVLLFNSDELWRTFVIRGRFERKEKVSFTSSNSVELINKENTPQFYCFHYIYGEFYFP